MISQGGREAGASMAITIRKLQEQHGGEWGEHPDFPVEDWQQEVAADDTRKGYWGF